ncbi:hypothetical protein [Campylobacter troglodytis]|nr:hypothetical protein [Campylobacter troglodytis]
MTKLRSFTKALKFIILYIFSMKIRYNFALNLNCCLGELDE